MIMLKSIAARSSWRSPVITARRSLIQYQKRWVVRSNEIQADRIWKKTINAAYGSISHNTVKTDGLKTGWLVSTSTSARNSDNLVFIGWQSSESDSFKLMTSLTPRFSISKIRFEALLRLRLLRHWKLTLTEFASSLKFVELGLVNYAQCWEDVLLKAGKHRSKVRSGSFFFQNSTYKLTIHSASDALD